MIRPPSRRSGRSNTSCAARVESMEYLQRIARTRRQLIADVEGSEPETAGILLAHIDELGQALNQHYRPAQPRFSDDSDQ